MTIVRMLVEEKTLRRKTMEAGWMGAYAVGHQHAANMAEQKRVMTVAGAGIPRPSRQKDGSGKLKTTREGKETMGECRGCMRDTKIMGYGDYQVRE